MLLGPIAFGLKNKFKVKLFSLKLELKNLFEKRMDGFETELKELKAGQAKLSSEIAEIKQLLSQNKP